MIEQLHRLREAREALTQRVRRLEDRVAELYEENERLREEIRAEAEREERLFVRLPFYEAIKAERDALRERESRVWAECDDAIRDHERGFRDAAIQGLLNIRAALEGGDGNGDGAGDADR